MPLDFIPLDFFFSSWVFVLSHCLIIFLSLYNIESWNDICWYFLTKDMMFILILSCYKRTRKLLYACIWADFLPSVYLGRHAIIFTLAWGNGQLVTVPQQCPGKVLQRDQGRQCPDDLSSLPRQFCFNRTSRSAGCGSQLSRSSSMLIVRNQLKYPAFTR